MYPECRHVRPSGSTCRAAAIAGSHFHARFQQRQTIRHTHRQADGRFAPLAHLDRRPRLAHRPQTAERVLHPEQSERWEAQNTSLDLPPIEVLQALAANQLGTKRAGLLLYGLQVASANAKHIEIPSDSVRTVTYTSGGIALAPQDYGWDLEDIEKEISREDEEEEEEEE